MQSILGRDIERSITNEKQERHGVVFGDVNESVSGISWGAGGGKGVPLVRRDGADGERRLRAV